MAMVVARWRREGDGGGSEGEADWEATLAAITMAGLARATVAVGLARAALVRARAEHATEAAASEQSLSVPSPQHRDFRDQHDEPRRFCAGAAFQRLLRARLPQSNGSPGAICQPRAAEEKNELCS